MVDKHLAKAVIDIAIFLEFSSEDILDQNAAVEALEQLSNELQQASRDVQRDLEKSFRELADDYENHRDFVVSLGDCLGISS